MIDLEFTGEFEEAGGLEASGEVEVEADGLEGAAAATLLGGAGLIALVEAAGADIAEATGDAA